MGQDRAAAFLRSKKQAQEMARRHDEDPSVQPHAYQIGEFVKLKNNAQTTFQDAWKGPFIIEGVGPNDTYYLKKPNGDLLRHPYNYKFIQPFTTREDYSTLNSIETDGVVTHKRGEPVMSQSDSNSAGKFINWIKAYFGF